MDSRPSMAQSSGVGKTQQTNGVIVENGSSVVANGNSVQMTNGCGFGDGEMSSDVIVRRRKAKQLSSVDTDIIRLIGQHLRELGFNKTMENLMDESGCALEHPKAARFRSNVIAGEWDRANQALTELLPLVDDPASVEKMRFLLLKEKYLELLESGHKLEALRCLRSELAPLPLHHSDKHIEVLTSYMMYSDMEDLRQAADWPGVKGGARKKLMEKLQGFLPASVMLPPKRLQHLLTQAVQNQIESCPFHYLDQSTSEYSLLTDHVCSRSRFPSEAVYVLTDHSDEVWHIRFSHDGSRLASGSRDGQVIIWNISGPQPVKEQVLKAQADGVAFLVWSPDDCLLLCCGREDSPDAMVFNTETGEMTCRVQNSAEDSLTCCAWHNSGTKFYVGGTKGQFLECAMDGSVTASWEGIRVHAIATHPEADLVYAADTHSRIRQYNFRDKTSCTLVQESHPIMSFTLSKTARHALLNVATQGVHVWDLEDKCLVRRYQGVTQGLYTIHSSYGGASDNFITSGSEDHNVYIWHHRRETPVMVLKGHSRAVNCVSWNPARYDVLASASDDGTVRIWGTEEQVKAALEHQRLQQREEQRSRSTDREGGSLEQGSPLQDVSLSLPEAGGGGGGGGGGEGGASSGRLRLGPIELGSGRSEGMEIQQQQQQPTEDSSDTQTSELERLGDSTSSLSSERLDEGYFGIVALPVIASNLVERTGQSSHELRAVSLSLQQSRGQGEQQQHSVEARGSQTSPGGATALTPTSVTTPSAITLVHTPVSSSSMFQDVSIDQESSLLTLDSSNGNSSSQIEISISQQPETFQEEEEEEEGGGGGGGARVRRTGSPSAVASPHRLSSPQFLSADRGSEREEGGGGGQGAGRREGGEEARGTQEQGEGSTQRTAGGSISTVV